MFSLLLFCLPRLVLFFDVKNKSRCKIIWDFSSVLSSEWWTDYYMKLKFLNANF